jgi:hypothetical protein
MIILLGVACRLGPRASPWKGLDLTLIVQATSPRGLVDWIIPSLRRRPPPLVTAASANSILYRPADRTLSEMPLLYTVYMIDDYNCWRPYVRSNIAHCWKHIIVNMMKICTNFPVVYIKTAVHSDQRCCSLIPACSWISSLSVQTVVSYHT